MRVPLKDVTLWYPEWSRGIPFTGYFKDRTCIQGYKYTFQLDEDEDCWSVFTDSQYILMPIGTSRFTVKGDCIENLFSLIRSTDGKQVQYSRSVPGEAGVTVQFAALDDVYLEGEAFTLDGDDFNA